MPIYESECVSCRLKYQFYTPLPTDLTRECPKCGGEGERIYSLAAVRIFQPFCTRNILPDGKPIEITNQRQLSHLCNEFHLNHIDDPKAEIKHQAPKTMEDILGERILPMNEEVTGGACSESELLKIG